MPTFASQSRKVNGFDVYTIIAADGNTSAAFVPEKGGVVSSITMPFAAAKREILFQHENFWERNDHKDLVGGLPFIFPICARIERDGVAGNYLYNGKVYNLPIHGFAPYMPWEVTQAETDNIILRLRATPETLACYPFHFLVELQYRVTRGELICCQRYSNLGDAPMPYYAGFHPYFLTPPVGAGKEQVVFNYQPKRCLKYNSRLTDIIGEQELPNLPAAVANPVVNEKLVELDFNKCIELFFPDGFKLHMEANGIEDEDMFSYVQFYTMAEKPFACLEPWMSFPNALNTVSGVRWLQPGQSEHAALSIWV